MPQRSQSSSSLQPPKMAQEDPRAFELLRVWAAPDGCQQMTLETTWHDPGAWGLLLVDIARHVSIAYAKKGTDRNTALKRIRELFDAEWNNPTDEPKDITEQ